MSPRKLFYSSLRDSAAVQKSWKSLEGGSPRRTGQACLVDLKPGSTNTPVLWPLVCSPNNFGIPRNKDQELSYEVVGPQQLHCNMQCNVSSAGTEVRTGTKWKAEKAMEVEFCRRQKALVEDVATGRAGVGSFPKTQVSQSRDKERHHLLQEEFQAGMEEDCVGRPVGLCQQGAWTRWERYIVVQHQVTWSPGVQQTSMHEGRARHLPASFAPEEAL